MPQRTSEQGPLVGRKESFSPAGVGQVTDEEVDRLFAKVTSRPPPPPRVDDERQTLVDATDINELDDPGPSGPSTSATSDRPPARQLPAPRPRTVTLLGMPAPSAGERGARRSSFPPAPLPPLASRPTRQISASPAAARLGTSSADRADSSRVASVRSATPEQATPPSLKAPEQVVTAGSSPPGALRPRVFVAGGELPLWALLASMALPLVLVSALLGVASTVRGRDAGSALTSVGPSVQVAAAPAAAAPSAPPHAAASSPKPALAAEEVDERGTRGVAGILQRASARLLHETSMARQFADVLGREPSVIEQPAVLAELRQHVSRAHAAPEALRGLAAMEGPVGADLLYEIWTSTKGRTDTSELARELVYSREVRAKASPALNVALDLRVAQGCEAQRPLLRRAASDGDRRALPALAKLLNNRGCGANKRQDCFACLRKADELPAAIKAAKQRRAPKRLPAL